jgi:hypothetical protein
MHALVQGSAPAAVEMMSDYGQRIAAMDAFSNSDRSAFAQ